MLGATFFEGRPLLTRGRWLNSIVFLIYKLLSHTSVFKKRSSPIFIIGVGRSGTTILGKILSLHKQAAYLNEPKALFYFLESQDDLIGSYSHGKGAYYFDREPTSFMTKKGKRILSAFSFLARGKRLIVKYPEMIFRVNWLLKLFPEAQFLMILRNGHDVALSIELWNQKNRYFDKNGNKIDWWGHNDKKWHLLVDQVLSKHSELGPKLNQIKLMDSDYDRGIVEWILTMHEFFKISSTLQVSTIRYEELIKKPKEVSSDILASFNLSMDSKMLTYAFDNIKSSTKKVDHTLDVPLLLKASFENLMSKAGY